ncbi:MAG: T9SS C-terminal target domain-containing protein [Calditrichaeota bacterium]|nr:MAG: T9SS C-terminal target domain-containing protein [Calditrichota bacterium]
MSRLKTYLLVMFTTCNLAADIPRSLYVINGSAETLSKMNLETLEIKRDIVTTGQIPNHILTFQDRIFILNSGTSSIQIIDPRTDMVARTILLRQGSNPWSMAVVGRRKLYVTHWVTHQVSVVDLESGRVIKEIPVGRGPEGILVVNNLVFITNSGYAGWGLPFQPGSVNIVDGLTDSVIDTLLTPVNPQDAALAPDGRVHVLCTGNYTDIGAKIAVIDLFTGPDWDQPAVIDTIDIGGSPGDLEITPSGQAYAVAWGDGASGFLYQYDAFSGQVSHDALHPLFIGPNTSQVVYDGRENCLWIPFMSMWGGDGYIQKWDVATNSSLDISQVISNGSQKAAILERIWDITPWADSVFSFIPGLGGGYGENYFPENVLGPPDQSPGLNEFVGSNRPQEVLSLGKGGQIILEFTDNVITNGEGADFTIFENVFISAFDQKPFIEAGIVAVSQDGKTFIEFPYDLDTWQGLAGVTPMKDNYHFNDPFLSGGDQFDLETLGLSWARYVKITDLGDLKKEGNWNGDFDLDAVVAVHSASNVKFQGQSTVTIHSYVLEPNFPNPFNAMTILPVHLEREADIQLEIVNIDGQCVRRLYSGRLQSGRHAMTWDGMNDGGAAVSSGLYIARLSAEGRMQVQKLTLLR